MKEHAELPILENDLAGEIRRERLVLLLLSQGLSREEVSRLLGMDRTDVLSVQQADIAGLPSPAELRQGVIEVWQARLKQQRDEHATWVEARKKHRELQVRNNLSGRSHARKKPASKIQRRFNEDQYIPGQGRADSLPETCPAEPPSKTRGERER